MRFVNFTMLSADDSVNQLSSALDANQLVSASFHAYFGDSSAGGTFKIQASNDPTNNTGGPVPFTPTNWVDIPNATATITSGAAALITISQCSYRWLRVVWTHSAGGTTKINVNIMALSV